MVTLKYSEMSSYPFAQAIQKITSTPMHGSKASQIHKIGKELTRAREMIAKAYQTEIVEMYAEKDAEGKVIRPENEPNGFTPADATQEAFLAAQEEFGKKTIALDCSPITLAMLEDVKISAQDLESLRGMYFGNAESEAGPGLHAVR